MAALFLAAASGSAAAATSAARVTYLAGASVYVDAGRDQGLALGDTVRVVRGGATIALLRVAFVSSARASCDTLRVRAPVAVGDAVAFTPHRSGETQAPAVPPAATPEPPETRAKAPPPLHGRAGLRMLSVANDVGGVGRTALNQPGLDLRLDGAIGARASVSLDVRSRHTISTVLGARESESAVRVYRGALALRNGTGHLRLTAGRQSAASVSTISLFDGLMVEADAGRGAIGAFGGVLPEPGSLGISGDISQFGLFYRLRPEPRPTRRWSLSVGGASSWQAGQSNRDFLFTQASWWSPALSGWFAQEVDVNRGWKRSMGEPLLSPTSTFASVRAPIGRRFALDAGFDNRRNVRLYRDRLTPETQFDDSYRQGAWVGATIEPVRGARIAGNVRRNGGGSAGPGTAWSTNAYLRIPTFVPLSLRGRYARHDDDRVESTLASLGFGVDPAGAFHVEVAGGRRDTRDTGWNLESLDRWENLSLDLGLGPRVYFNLTTEHDRGDGGSMWQHSGGLSWRF